MVHNPFEPSKSRAGYGEAHVTLLPPATPVFQALNYTYPLKLIASAPFLLHPVQEPEAVARTGPPRPRPDRVPLLFMLTYGGGLLPGDSVDFHLLLQPATRLTLATQGSTKIFPAAVRDDARPRSSAEAPVQPASQHLRAKIQADAALLLSPDPIQPFRSSHYAQVQVFDLEPDASLGLLDWVTSGRPAREEVWDAGSWTGRNEIWRCSPDEDGSTQRRLLLRDALYLEGGPQGIGQSTLKEERKGVFGTLMLIGALFEAMGDFFLREFFAQPKVGGYVWDDEHDGQGSNGAVQGNADSSEPAAQEAARKRELEAWRKERLAQERQHEVLWTAAKVRGVFIVKFAAQEVEGAKVWLNDMFTRDGTIEREFGPGGLLSVR